MQPSFKRSRKYVIPTIELKIAMLIKFGKRVFKLFKQKFPTELAIKIATNGLKNIV